MNITAAIQELHKTLKHEAPDNCVAFEIRFTAEGYYVNYETRLAEEMKKNRTSMRNLRGEWIHSEVGSSG
jgi:hypothetical protein